MAVPLAHAVRLNPEQRKTARIFDREADRFGARPVLRLALFEAGLTEANLGNPAYGDGTSVGSLQEIDSYGSVARRLNRKLAARRFLREGQAILDSGFKGGAGQLAQAIQRSAFPDRYGQRRGEALQIIDAHGGLRGRGASGGGGGGGVLERGAPGAGAQAFDPGAPGASASVVDPGPQPIASAGVPEPAFAARPVLPEGYSPAPSIGGPAPAPEPAAAQGPQGLSEDFSPDLAPAGGSGGGRVSGMPSRVGGRGGKVTFAPGADRPGVRTKAPVRRFLREVSALAGRPVRVGTGSNHQEFTASGSVSDHWRGMGADVPASGRRLIELGQAALIAAGMPERKARRQRGGLYNIGGVQVIFNTDGPGIGNHRDHLHVGVQG
jgi:hypothetical protein